MKTLVLITVAVGMLSACERQAEPAPASTPAPPDRVEQPTPPGQLPALDTMAASPAGQPAAGGVSRTPAQPGNVPAGGGARPAVEPAGGAQDDGAAVLQRASVAYAALRSLKADFVMQLNNPLLRQQTTSRGTLYQRRPDRLALRFSDPAGDLIVADGEYFWVYTPSLDSLQVIQASASAGGGQSVDLQAQFVGDPVRRFRYTLHGQETVGERPAHVLTLEPRERVGYKSLKVWLDTRDALARRFEITEENGTVRRFELSNFEPNASIPDATFRFVPPRGARVVRG